MTKQEFLEELKQALAGEVPANVMMDSYSYYANYIEDEIRHGKSETEVIEELGKPMLIARSIIAAQTGERKVDYEYTEDGRTRTVRGQSYRQREGSSRGQAAGRRSEEETDDSGSRRFSLNLNGVLAKIMLVILILMLIIVVYFVLKIGFWVLATFGIPILLILGIIYLIMYFSR